MKRIILLVTIASLLSAGIVAAEEPDPIMDARAHAQMDGSRYNATGWGFLAFGASALFSPLLGGGTVIVLANVIQPDVDVPPPRLAEAQSTYDSSNELVVYQSQYQESMERPIQKDRSRRAWLGTGIGFALNLVLIYAILAAY